MAQRKGSTGEGANHPLHNHEYEAAKAKVESPAHPVPSMQKAFEESIVESADESDAPSSPEQTDAQARRQKLLESTEYDDTWVSRWQQKPTARYHPLLKLMAQIVFGMHLLQQQQAKSEEEVVKILQSHVNEVDTFLERTSEDFDLAIRDIEDRIRYLQLPMTHMEVFETMLDDKKFRTQLLEGNEKIEKIIDRTTRAMNATLLDVQHGYKANKELARYLDSVQTSWPSNKSAVTEVLGAMRGNEQGWRTYLKNLHSKGKSLGKVLAQLHAAISEMSKMAAAASRRNKTQSRNLTSGAKSVPSSPVARSKFSQDSPPQVPSPPQSTNLNKPLPTEPAAVAGAPAEPTSKPHPVPFALRYESTRSSPIPPRPRTAGSTAREARDARAADTRVNTSDLVQFLQRSDPQRNIPNPLRSNPPDDVTILPGGSQAEKQTLDRSQSQGATLVPSTPAESHWQSRVARSRSQGTMNVPNQVNAAKLVVDPRQTDKDGDDLARPSFERKDRKDSGHRSVVELRIFA